MGTTHPLNPGGRSWLLPLAMTLLLWPAWAVAHPYHTSFAEIGWNQAGDQLEVSLRVLPEDLETALTWRAGHAVVLGQSEDAQTLSELYLQSNFQLRDSDGNLLPLTLLGMEVAYDETWLYFTIPARTDMRLQLSNTVLMDVDSSQTNRVQALWTTPDSTLIFTSASPESTLWRGH